MPTEHTDAIRQINECIADLHARLDAEHLNTFLELLLTWNPELGLVSRRDTPGVTARLIRQSLQMWDFTLEILTRQGAPPPRRVLDVGSGAGFPGIVWKIQTPRLDLTLLERKTRRALFLERLVRRLGLAQVQVIEADLERAATEAVYDLVAMMAVSSPRDAGPTIERMLHRGGYLVATRNRDKPIDETVGAGLVLATAESTPPFLLYRKD